MGEPSQALVGRDDDGVTVFEVAVASVIAMIGFALVAVAISAAQKQEQTIDSVARTADVARFAMAEVTDQGRQARWIKASGADGIMWIDSSGDGVEQASETVTFRVETVSGDTRFVRIQDGVTEILASGLTSGTITVATTPRGSEMTIDLVVPGRDSRVGTTISSVVSTRANG